jgi:hypothetical protein
MEELKKQAIEAINETEGGFFLVTYDKNGFSEILECIGDNEAAYAASKLSQLLSRAQMDYINWRTKEAAK